MASHRGVQQGAPSNSSQSVETRTVITVDNIPAADKEAVKTTLQEILTGDDTTADFVKKFGPRVVAKVYKQEFMSIYGGRPETYLEDLPEKRRQQAQKEREFQAQCAAAATYHMPSSMQPVDHQVIVRRQETSPDTEINPGTAQPTTSTDAPDTLGNKVKDPPKQPPAPDPFSDVAHAQFGPSSAPPFPQFGGATPNPTTALGPTFGSARPNTTTAPPMPNFGSSRHNPFDSKASKKRKADTEATNKKVKSPRKG